MSMVSYPAARMMSTNVVAVSDSGMPFWRAPCSDGMRPVINVAVGHADRRSDVKTIEARPGLGEAIDIGRFHHVIAVATQMVGAMLVGDDEDKIRPFVHG